MLLALQIGAQLGSLLLAVAVVLIALQSMRVGLLPRPLGYVGIFAGALILFPVFVVPIVQMGWLLAVGYLFTGRWPSGRATGVADRQGRAVAVIERDAGPTCRGRRGVPRRAPGRRSGAGGRRSR